MSRQKKISRTGKMNFVDWFLLALALISVAVFVYFAFFSELQLFGDREQDVSIDYTVRVEKVNAQWILGLTDSDLPDDRKELKSDFVKVGDKVYASSDGALIGRVTSVTYERSKSPTDTYDENGSLIYADYFGHVDIIITVKADGISSDGVYSINGHEVRVGADVDFRTEGYTALGTCESVNGKEAQ